jgi:hypothetical protein
VNVVALPMVMRKKDQVYIRQVMKIHCRIRASGPGHAWSQMYMISCMQEVGLQILSSWYCRDL